MIDNMIIQNFRTRTMYEIQSKPCFSIITLSSKVCLPDNISDNWFKHTNFASNNLLNREFSSPSPTLRYVPSFGWLKWTQTHVSHVQDFLFMEWDNPLSLGFQRLLRRWPRTSWFGSTCVRSQWLMLEVNLSHPGKFMHQQYQP